MIDLSTSTSDKICAFLPLYNKCLAVAEMGEHLATRDNRHGLKTGGGESWIPIQHNVAWAEAYLHTKWHPDPSSHLATTDIG